MEEQKAQESTPATEEKPPVESQKPAVKDPSIEEPKVDLSPEQLLEIQTGIHRLKPEEHEKLVKLLEPTKLIALMRETMKSANGYKFISVHHYDDYPSPIKTGMTPIVFTLHTVMPALINRKLGWVAQDMKKIIEANKKSSDKSKEARLAKFKEVLQKTVKEWHWY